MVQNFEGIISDIVKADYRAADVFKKYSINFCCSGLIPLRDACNLKEIDYDLVTRDLEMATQPYYLPEMVHVGAWRLDFLIDYIINIHHASGIRSAVSLTEIMHSFLQGHRKKYPELEGLDTIFLQLSALNEQHNAYEEEVIFPYIRQIDRAHRNMESYGELLVRTLRKPLTTASQGHDVIDILLEQMKSVTNNFMFPQKACTNHQVLFHKLRAFYNNMVQHHFLEKLFLFPKAIEIERQLMGESNFR